MAEINSDALDIDISQVEAKLEELTNKMNELHEAGQLTSEQFKGMQDVIGNLSDYCEDAKKSIESTAEANEKLSDSADKASESFQKQAKNLNDTDDIADFTGKAIQALGLDETALGNAVNSASEAIQKSVRFLKSGAKAADAMKASTNGATAATNGLRAALTALAKHPIIILLTGIAATMAIVYKRFRDFTDANFAKRLGVIERGTQLVNERLENELALLNAIGAKQSTIVQKQASNLEDLNKRLETTVGYYQEMWDEMGGNGNLGYLANEYLKGNVKLIEELDEKEKELVKKYAEAKEQIRLNKVQLEEILPVMEQIAKLNEDNEDSLESYNKSMDDISRKYSKIEASLQRQLSKQSSILAIDKEDGDLSDHELENMAKIYELEDKLADVQIARSDKEINAIEQRIKDTERLYSEAEKIGNEQQKSLLIDQKRNLEQQKMRLEMQRQNLINEKNIRSYELQAKFTTSMLENVKKINNILLKQSQDRLSLLNVDAFGSVSKDEYFSQYKSIFKDVNRILEEFDLNITSVKNTANELFGEMPKGINDLTTYMVKAKEAIESGVDDKTKAKYLDFINSANNAVQEYYQITSDLSNKLSSEGIEMLNTLKERFESIAPEMMRSIGDTISDVFSDESRQFTDKGAAMKFFADWITEITELNGMLATSLDYIKEGGDDVKGFMTELEGMDIFSIYDKGDIEEVVKFIELGGDEALKYVKSLSNDLTDSIYEMQENLYSNIEALSSSQLSYMDEFYSLGDTTMREYYSKAEDVIDSHYDYRKAVLQREINDMRKAGATEAEINQYKADTEVAIEKEKVDRKRKLNQDYQNEILGIAASTTSDINSIAENAFQLNEDMSDKQFENHKKIQGATLVASTYAQAAQAYGSTFAQAPGGVAAKTIQAGIASAAVLASGIAAYNKLMSTTKETSSMDSSTSQAASFTPVETSTSTVARTLIGGRYNQYSQDIQTVLVVNDVERKQMEERNLRRVATI